MANGQNIEERLRAYAQQRKREAGGPFTLSPVTRRLLHVEVDRRWGATAQQRQRQRWWEAWMPHLGWATATVGLVLICLLAVWQSGREEKQPPQLATQKSFSRPIASSSTARIVAAKRPTNSRRVLFGSNRARGVAPAPTVSSIGPAPASRSGAAVPGPLMATQTVAPPVALNQNMVRSVAPSTAQPPTVKLGTRSLSNAVAAAALMPSPATRDRRSARTAESRHRGGFGGPPAPVLPKATGTTARTAATLGENLAATTHLAHSPALVGAAPNPAFRQMAVTTQALGAGMLQVGDRFMQEAVTPSNKAAVPFHAQTQPAQTHPAAPLTNAMPISTLPGASPPPREHNFQQQFVQTWPGVALRRNFNSPPMPDVLQNFRVEQAGRALRIVDQDGSVYAVKLGPTERTARGPAERFLRSIAALLGNNQSSAGKAAEPMAFFFNAAGMNRTLHEPVTFDGELIFTNAAQLRPPPAHRAVTNSAALRVWLSNSVLAGEAQVGQGTRVVIEARPE